MNLMRKTNRWLIGLIGIAVTSVIFLVPFAFVILQASKDKKSANLSTFSLPETFLLWDNLKAVIEARDYMLLTAFLNSFIITVAAVFLMVVLGAMIAFVLDRRKSKLNPLVNTMVLAGLIIPPAVVPTIWVMQTLHIFKTIPGLILIEAVFGLSFTILIMRAFVATIPREIDQAAIVDGAGPLKLFFSVIFPLLRSTIITVTVVQAVTVFNDFQNPLYFLPGKPTVQLTLYNFKSQFEQQYNLLFADILLITIPPLIMYIFFQRQIVSGMTSGAIKG